MAVELVMGYEIDMKIEENAVKEAASGLESVQNLVRLLSKQNQNQNHIHSSSTYPNNNDPSSGYPADVDYKAVADVAVSKFKKVISLLGQTRTGHARFRRAPLPSSSSSSGRGNNNSSNITTYHTTPIQQILPPSHHNQAKMVSMTSFNFSCSSAPNSFATSFTSGQTADNSRSKLTSSSCCKTKCTSSDISGSEKCRDSASGRCHCSKRRKMRTKRVVRVPAVSLKLADIPPDDFSWRKYGQKPIKGSPHPRGYYKCSSLRGCPARKHVERALDDPNMLIVTYECEHNHSISVADSSALILESS